MDNRRKEQFRKRFEKYYPKLCRIASGYIPDDDDCEDVVQDLFVNVWNKGKDKLPEEEFAAYLNMSVRNNCLTFLRRQRYFDTVSVDDKPTALADVSTEEDKTADYRQMLDGLLEQLPPKCREVFMMSKLLKMRYKDIAAELGISEKTVENHMGKAIKILRSFVAEHPILMIIITLSNFIAAKL